jgi:uncharacterized membrane protein
VNAKIFNRLMTMLVTAVLMLLTLLEWNLDVVQILFAIALVAILPGYAVMTAIFINYPLSFIEKFAFSGGLSLAIASVGGLILHFTPWGLQTDSWVFLLGGITLVANGVALLRIYRAPDEVDLSVTHIPLRLHQIGLMLLAGLIITGAYLMARAGEENRPVPQYSQLWMLWNNEDQSEVMIGVHNHTDQTQTYRLELSSQRGLVEEWPLITLEPDTTWLIEYAPPTAVGENDALRAALYRLDNPQERYREVFLRWPSQ